MDAKTEPDQHQDQQADAEFDVAATPEDADHPDFQQRLRALVEAEEGALKQQRDEAESRLSQTQGLLADARAEYTRERERTSRLEAALEQQSSGRKHVEQQLDDTRA